MATIHHNDWGECHFNFLVTIRIQVIWLTIRGLQFVNIINCTWHTYLSALGKREKGICYQQEEALGTNTPICYWLSPVGLQELKELYWYCPHKSASKHQEKKVQMAENKYRWANKNWPTLISLKINFQKTSYLLVKTWKLFLQDWGWPLTWILLTNRGLKQDKER